MLHVRTKTGSLYALDLFTAGSLRWHRMHESAESGFIRTLTGELLTFPRIQVGEPMNLVGPPIKEGTAFHLIVTSPVFDIRWTVEPLPNYGYVLPIADFQECCEDGSFINYDGTGYFANPPMMDRHYPAIPSEVKAGKIPVGFTHVVWFNR